ncbi:MAG: signal peptidase II [Puniceicoccales bacterium]|jgi:signal peptidase II|nr:signal peptidase II [Puniceicoccales bacterium]
MKSFQSNICIFVWTLLLVFFDQFSKVSIAKYFPINEPYVIVPNIFSICYVINTGSVWGIFQNSSHVLAYCGIAAIVGLCIFMPKISLPNHMSKLAFSGALGGIIGNSIDRFYRLGVIDFLDFHYKSYHWPCFNLADAYLCLACIFFMLTSIRKNKA